MNSIYEVRILIVDDNKDLLHLLCEQLSGAGYRHIQTAANCAAAKKLFAAEIPVFPKQKDIKKQPMFTCLQTKEYCY